MVPASRRGFFFLLWLRSGRLGWFSGHCDGGGGHGPPQDLPLCSPFVLASTHADLVLGVVAEARDGYGRGGVRRIDVSVVDRP